MRLAAIVEADAPSGYAIAATVLALLFLASIVAGACAILFGLNANDKGHDDKPWVMLTAVSAVALLLSLGGFALTFVVGVIDVIVSALVT